MRRLVAILSEDIFDLKRPVLYSDPVLQGRIVSTMRGYGAAPTWNSALKAGNLIL